LRCTYLPCVDIIVNAGKVFEIVLGLEMASLLYWREGVYQQQEICGPFPTPGNRHQITLTAPYGVYFYLSVYSALRFHEHSSNYTRIMDKIRILQEQVATQIAAGEVIERPASVVRELLDNSIDAESDKIIIRIKEGGRRLIRFSDNGVGMSRDDLLLSLERYATSKINSTSDLFAIKTLGFRGEALPSISSVSRMEITSRPVDQLIGYRLRATGGQLNSIDEMGTPAGTVVEVRDLFFNTPARRKFLRSAKTEADHIVDTVSRIILPFKHIQLRLDDAGKTILHVPASEKELDRLLVLMGRNIASSMIEAYQETGGVALRTYLAPPDANRNRGDRIYIYVNRRSIKDRLVMRAIMEGYGERLMKGRYPQAVIFIDIDPSLVDVNVHPTKQEVRFHNGQVVYKTLVSIIEGTLRQQFKPVFEVGYRRPEGLKEEQVKEMTILEPRREYLVGEQKEATPLLEKELHEEYLVKESPQIIGQLKDTYILCQVRDGLLMFDQHAAHERIVYETLKKTYKSSQIETQPFLIPPKLELSLKDRRVIIGKLDQLAVLGLELEHFGGNTFLLRSVHSTLIDVLWDEFLTDLIPILEEEGDIARDRALDRLWTVMACHGAIRAGTRMSREEMTRLLHRLERMDLPTHCPHGRPIFKMFTYYEIEKLFKRVV
jgi:DNA mismatch repair protein MutL